MKIYLNTWTWINVPLEVEAEVCPVDCSWNEKEIIISNKEG